MKSRRTGRRGDFTACGNISAIAHEF